MPPEPLGSIAGSLTKPQYFSQGSEPIGDPPPSPPRVSILDPPLSEASERRGLAVD